MLGLCQRQQHVKRVGLNILVESVLIFSILVTRSFFSNYCSKLKKLSFLCYMMQMQVLNSTAMIYVLGSIYYRDCVNTF